MNIIQYSTFGYSIVQLLIDICHLMIKFGFITIRRQNDLHKINLFPKYSLIWTLRKLVLNEREKKTIGIMSVITWE